MPDVSLGCECIPKYQATAVKDDHAVLIYRCYKCGKLFNEFRYRYVPENCPKHQFEFEGWGFEDNQQGRANELFYDTLLRRPLTERDSLVRLLVLNPAKLVHKVPKRLADLIAFCRLVL